MSQILEEHNLDIKKAVMAILFLESDGISLSTIVRRTGYPESEVEEVLNTLKETLENLGLTIIKGTDNVIALSTSSACSSFVENFKKSDAVAELSRPTLETLSLILYRKDGVTKSELDYVRGVNTTLMIRSLSVRGLISLDETTGKYKPTVEFLASLGVTKVEDLPDFEKVNQDFGLLSQSNITQENQNS